MRKKLLLICVLTFKICIVFSQETENTRTYQTRNDIAVFPSTLTGVRIDNNNVHPSPPLKSEYRLIRFKGDSAVIRFLRWRDPALRKTFNDSLINAISQKTQKDTNIKVANKYFLINRYDLDSNSVKYYYTSWRNMVFTLGLITMPIKLRLGSNFDFQGNLSLGTSAGVKKRISHFNPNYVNFLLGASISTITLDSFSTNGKVPTQPITNIAVFSPSLGVVFEFGKAQAGLFYGWDFLNKSTQSRYGWIYDRKPWLSIGFGFSIFSVESKAVAKAESDQK